MACSTCYSLPCVLIVNIFMIILAIAPDFASQQYPSLLCDNDIATKYVYQSSNIQDGATKQWLRPAVVGQAAG